MEMMKKKNAGKCGFVSLLLLLLFSTPAFAQNSKKDLKLIREEAQRIEQNPDYYWGVGSGSTQDEASRMALVDLQSKIHVTVKSNVTMKMGDEHIGQELKSYNNTDIDIETSTGGVLTNTKSFIIAEAPQWQVLRYVEKKEVEAAFEKRKERVFEYMKDAQQSEQTGRIDNALRYYYWAFCLLRSLQYPDEVTFVDQSYTKQRLIHWIPKQMEEIFENLKVEAGTKDGDALNLVATYKDKPVTSLDFVYSVGDQQSPLVSFKDGTTQIDLPSGETADQLLLSYEYEYEGRSSQDRDGLQTMVRRFKDDSLFPKAQQQLKVGSKKQQRAAQAVFQAAVEEVSQAQNAVEVQNHAGQEAAVKRVLDAIRSRNFESAKGVFTEQGYQMFTSLINYGNARLLGKADLHFYESTNGRVVCRSIPMSFAFKSNHVTFTEEVTLTFNPEGQIESLAFGLDNDTRQLIFDSPAQWSTSVRMAIATFLENYKTAFALKDLDYIKSIFDDYAIIVTGHVTMRAPQNPELSQKGSTMVKYTQYNKEQYMKRLEEQFQQKKFINLRFTDVGVKLLGRGDDTYALRIKQDYFSSTYADTGYLFLMVDMNDPSAPLIKLRTWQPHRDPTINSNLPKDNPFHGLLYEGNFQ
jgi:hypothetical protein